MKCYLILNSWVFDSVPWPGLKVDVWSFFVAILTVCRSSRGDKMAVNAKSISTAEIKEWQLSLGAQICGLSSKKIEESAGHWKSLQVSIQAAGRFPSLLDKRSPKDLAKKSRCLGHAPSFSGKVSIKFIIALPSRLFMNSFVMYWKLRFVKRHFWSNVELETPAACQTLLQTDTLPCAIVAKFSKKLDVEFSRNSTYHSLAYSNYIVTTWSSAK